VLPTGVINHNNGVHRGHLTSLSVLINGEHQLTLQDTSVNSSHRQHRQMQSTVGTWPAAPSDLAGSLWDSRRWRGCHAPAPVRQVMPTSIKLTHPLPHSAPAENIRWLRSRVVSVLDSGAVGHTPIVPLFTKQQNSSSPLKGCAGNCRPGGK